MLIDIEYMFILIDRVYAYIIALFRLVIVVYYQQTFEVIGAFANYDFIAILFCYLIIVNWPWLSLTFTWYASAY